MNPLLQLSQHGQSYWIDNLTRSMIARGDLERRVAEQDLRGVTSNPTIFHAAIAESFDYDAQIVQLSAQHRSARDIYEQLVVRDVADACDVLRPVYDRTRGQDGFVSLEVSPHLAHDSEGSLTEARRLSQSVNRPNLLIKIPGTAAAMAVIEELLFEGVNINITLLFSISRYEEVARAYLRALERRAADGRPLEAVHSVASFFLSRIDVLVDQLLEHRRGATRQGDGPTPESLLGKAAVANAKLAYGSFKDLLASARWQVLQRQGARPQRMLWASTSTKNPHYSDLMYVEPLIGPHTVNTMPDKTIAAFADHGRVADTLEEKVGDAQRVMQALEALGIDFDLVTRQLENEGIQKFIDPYDALLDLIEHKRVRHLRRLDANSVGVMAQKLRRQVIRMTTAAGSGHPTSCMSCAEIVAALFFREMRWDPTEPAARDVDSFVLSKGHAAPILWAVLREAGAIDEDPLSLRRIDSTLEGHPTARNPWVRVATGSLGQGLAASNGIALANRLDGIDARVYCLLGDGECSEGAVWEAAQFAALNRLSNLVAIVDVNGLGQSGPAPYGHATQVLARRFQAFGWNTREIDGHDVGSILDALYDAHAGGPTAIIARTEKGKGVSFLEGAEGWHGKALNGEQAEQALRELGEAEPELRVEPRRLAISLEKKPREPRAITVDYPEGAKAATRDGYGSALQKLGALHPEIVALDGDVQNSTRAEQFAERFPERFFQGYIAEQNMVGTALGLAQNGKVPFVATFACFLSRAHDFIRMAGHTHPKHLVFCGSHAGISIGEDGPSQMGLEDIALFRALGKSTILYPCDAVSAERLTEQAVSTEGIVYLRMTRSETPLIYASTEQFPVGGSKTLRASPRDLFTVVAAGITVHEALAAHDRLQQDGIPIRVVDAYSVKPVDVATLRQAARDTQGVLVVEDHWVDGGLGDVVSAVVGPAAPVYRLAVTEEPRSGKPAELLERCGISRNAIANAVLRLAAASANTASRRAAS
jgi:transketolase